MRNYVLFLSWLMCNCNFLVANEKLQFPDDQWEIIISRRPMNYTITVQNLNMYYKTGLSTTHKPLSQAYKILLKLSFAWCLFTNAKIVIQKCMKKFIACEFYMRKKTYLLTRLAYTNVLSRLKKKDNFYF